MLRALRATCALIAGATVSLVAAPAHADDHDLAGYRDGFFYLRDKSGDFVLYPQLRAQIDSYNYFGPGVADTTLKSTVLLRRVRPELAGELLGHWQFLVAGDWGQTGLDNPKGTNETAAAPPGVAPTAANGRYASAETASVKAGPADVFLNYRATELVNVQVGQYNPPFTLEGTASEKTMPFLERNMGSRLLANPSTKDLGLMLWGSLPRERAHYAIGVFNGDGQNRTNPDNRYDAIGRALVKPLRGLVDGPIGEAHVGASFRYGSRDPNYLTYDATTLTTTGNYAFWSPVYQSSKGYTHVIPSSRQLGLAGELRVPFSIFSLTSEAIWVDYRTRESVEGYQATNTERAGQMRGYSYYVQLSAWLFGPRDVIGNRLTNPPPHVDFAAPAKTGTPQALQAIVRWEQLHLSYDSASRHGVADAKNIDGDIKVNVLSAIATWWATRHVRLSAQYGLNMFPGSEPVKASAAGGPTQTSSQRAAAPAQNLSAGNNDSARDGGHLLHEVLFRAAIAL
jgi:phosphate-selective porin